jgi:hypothetical protein
MKDVLKLERQQGHITHPFIPVEVGDRFTVSIQASNIHASSPRESGLNQIMYTHWEVTIIENGEPVFPVKYKGLSDYLVYWHDDLGETFVGRFVPRVDVLHILDELEKICALTSRSKSSSSES